MVNSLNSVGISQQYGTFKGKNNLYHVNFRADENDRYVPSQPRPQQPVRTSQPQPMPRPRTAPPANSQQAMLMRKLQEAEEAQKKEKRKSNIAWAVSVAAGLAIVASFLFRGKTEEAAQKSITTANVKWQDFKGSKKVADLDSPTTSPKLRDAFRTKKNAGELSKTAKEWAGIDDGADIIYLYGHGGTGKTYVSEQYAQDLGALYTSIKYPDLGSPYKDAASMKITDLFDQIIEMAIKNKDRRIVVCIDEIDAVIRKVNDAAQGAEDAAKARAAVLTGVDKLRKSCNNVTLIGTSNYHPDGKMVDAIALRRFNNKIEVPLPAKDQIKALCKMYLEKAKAVDDKFYNSKEFDNFAQTLQDGMYSNGEISLICEEARKAFGATLNKVDDAKLATEHPFTIKYLEEGLKINGTAAAKNNNLMDV